MSEIAPTLPRIVLDTNVVLRGVINTRCASGRILDACHARKCIILLSRPVLAEYGAVLSDVEVVSRYPEVDASDVSFVLEKLRYLGDVIDTGTTRFELPRDPTDEKWVELAIAGGASHI